MIEETSEGVGDGDEIARIDVEMGGVDELEFIQRKKVVKEIDMVESPLNSLSVLVLLIVCTAGIVRVIRIDIGRDVLAVRFLLTTTCNII